jgi:hypothetical protein
MDTLKQEIAMRVKKAVAKALEQDPNAHLLDYGETPLTIQFKVDDPKKGRRYFLVSVKEQF